jgi:hypothetical protein
LEGVKTIEFYGRMTIQSGHNYKNLRKAYETMQRFKSGQMDVV